GASELDVVHDAGRAVEDLKDERGEALVLRAGLELLRGNQPIVDVFDLLTHPSQFILSAGWEVPHIAIARRAAAPSCWIWPMSHSPSLDALHAAIRRAKEIRDRPFAPGEVSRPALPLVSYLDEPGVR